MLIPTYIRRGYNKLCCHFILLLRPESDATLWSAYTDEFTSRKFPAYSPGAATLFDSCHRSCKMAANCVREANRLLPPCYAPRRTGALCDTAIRPSVPGRSCLRRAAALALGYSHRRTPEICGLRTRPRTDVDPTRVELPSAGGISSRRPRGDNLFHTTLHIFVYFLLFYIVFLFVYLVVRIS